MNYSVEVCRRFAAALAADRALPSDCDVCGAGTAEDRTLGVWARARIAVSAGFIEKAVFDVWGCPDTIAAADLPDPRAPAPGPAAASTLEEARRRFERSYLLERLREHGWNVSRTAESVGMARESLSRKIKALDLESERG